ncbi:MAG: acyl carrier protein [Thermoanaerobaculia bacterium]
MPAADRTAVVDSLRAWLVRANANVRPMHLAPDTDIIESRILESLQVVEFILFLEETSGRAILAEELNFDSLRTLDSIYESFFEVRS